MKTLLRSGFAALALAAAIPAFAADSAPSTEPQRQTHHGRAKMRGLMQRRGMDRVALAQKLGLTAEQRQQLKAKRANTAASVKAIRGDTSLTPEQKKAKLRETLQTSRTEMRAVLTPEQQTKLKTMKQRARRVAHRRTSL